MKAFMTIVIAVCCFQIIVKAQHTDRAIGMRAVEITGVTFKKFFPKEIAYEFIVGYGNRGVQAYFLREKHKVPKNSEFQQNFLLYYGFGGRIGNAYGAPIKFVVNEGKKNKNLVAFGLCAVAGVEYMFETLPVSIGTDFIPSVNITVPWQYLFMDASITFYIRHYF